MTALLDLTPVAVAPVDDITRGEVALAEWLDRCERLHTSNIQHDPVKCLLCFEQR